MSRFLSLKKKKPTEKAELNKGDDNMKDKDYGSISSLINNEAKKTGKFRRRKKSQKIPDTFYRRLTKKMSINTLSRCILAFNNINDFQISPLL